MPNTTRHVQPVQRRLWVQARKQGWSPERAAHVAGIDIITGMDIDAETDAKANRRQARYREQRRARAAEQRQQARTTDDGTPKPRRVAGDPVRVGKVTNIPAPSPRYRGKAAHKVGVMHGS